MKSTGKIILLDTLIFVALVAMLVFGAHIMSIGMPLSALIIMLVVIILGVIWGRHTDGN